MNWKSLSTPACLPLTTDFFPQALDLAKNYQEYTYTVSPADDITPYKDNRVNTEQRKVQSLLIELFSHRLSQGFQLTSQSIACDVERMLLSIKQPGARDKLSAFVDGDKVISDDGMMDGRPKEPYFLCLGNQIHRLGYDGSGKNVEVKRYVKQITCNNGNTLIKQIYGPTRFLDAIKYTCAIWSKDMEFYSPKTFRFSYPGFENYNWNYLDQLLSGYQEEMTDNLRFWRTRFLLIPSEAIPQSNSLLNPSGANLDVCDFLIKLPYTCI